MQITISEHRGETFHVSGFHIIDYLGENMREFSVNTTDNADLHRKVLDLVMEMESGRTAEYTEEPLLEIEAMWFEVGFVWTRLEDGAVILVTTTSFSVFLPVHDDFEDQETHWVGAVPVLRKLLAH